MLFIGKQVALYDNSTVISVIQNKGGSGKTSLITNLSGVIMRENARQLIVDLDSQANITDAFTLKQGRVNTGAMFGSSARAADIITRYSESLDIMQAHEDMGTLEIDLLPDLRKYGDPFGFVKPHIDEIRHRYEYIFIDTPPSLGLIVGNALAACDYVIIPFVPEPFAVKGLKRVIAAVRDFRAAGSGVEILAVVPMFIESMTVLHSQLLAQARRYCEEQGIYMTETVIPHSIRFASATAFEGLPATISRLANDKIVRHYFKLWGEIKNELRTNIIQ